MKLVIELDDKFYKYVCEEVKSEELVYKAIQNGIPLPDNATNGDMIKALFPKADIDGRHKEVYVVIDHEVLDFSESWWYSPYKKGEQE